MALMIFALAFVMGSGGFTADAASRGDKISKAVADLPPAGAARAAEGESAATRAERAMDAQRTRPAVITLAGAPVRRLRVPGPGVQRPFPETKAGDVRQREGREVRFPFVEINPYQRGHNCRMGSPGEQADERA